MYKSLYTFSIINLTDNFVNSKKAGNLVFKRIQEKMITVLCAYSKGVYASHV